MQAPDRVTIVLRAREGETLEALCQHTQLGAPVAIGRAGAVIASAHEGDRDEVAHQLQQQLVLADAALARSKAVHAPWNDVQVLDFCSVALRHVVVEGDLRFSDINDGLRHMAQKGKPAFVLAPSVDKDCVNQFSETGETVNRTTEKSSVVAPDPRDLFIAANPVGASADDLEKGPTGFVDARTHGEYLIFLAGYRAAQGNQP
jgi:hypothetical protein